ncbi:hypothetical protein [Massilibacteroides sp.]|uniref:hypothetical protein n=1 Tax=Massilibacteroides sp. TaxID=2034766 RepID=UPI002616FAA7|nr:hypothetical protein [Massilibacteroides sp.]MDD4515102.1 hypothetical protein [Massilibacteroides sp.]
MKKLFLGSLFALCTLLMTSCLDGGSNQNSGQTYGVIEYVNGKMLVNVGGGTYFYSPTIAADFSVNEGDCCFFDFVLDYDLAENADVATTGYYTVTTSYYSLIDNYYTSSSLRDTANIDPQELVVQKIESLSSYSTIWPMIDKNMFLVTYHEGILKGQTQRFDLSFDANQEPEVVNGENVYNLFLRVTKETEGTSPSQSGGIVNAFNLNSFLYTIGTKVQSAGKTNVKFKINYISSLNDDNTKAEWSSSDVATYTFPTEEE